MAVGAKTVSVGTTATLLEFTPLTKAENMAVYNPGPTTVYLGGSGVTTSTGYPLVSGQNMAIDNIGDQDLFAIVGTGTQTVNLLATGV